MITLIEKRTEKDPLQHIGEASGVCWGADITDVEKNIKRGKSCLKSGHMRTSEYVEIEMVIEGYSARAIRELYTHIIGTTRLQASTRYVNYDNFEFYNPFKEDGCVSKNVYDEFMKEVKDTYKFLTEDLDETKEDVANILPLGMSTKIVWKINLRGLIHFMNMRLCSRAYKEIRQLAKEIKDKLSKYSDEWKWICDEFFIPNCKAIGYCNEDHCCGLMPKGLEGLKEKIINEYKNTIVNNN